MAQFLSSIHLPKHVGQVHPGIGVLNGGESAGLPDEAASLLQETLHGATAWSTIQPNGNLVDWLTNGGLENEEKLSRLIILVNWHQARVHLTDVKGDIGQVVDQVLCKYGYFCVTRAMSTLLTLGVGTQKAKVLCRTDRLGVCRLDNPVSSRQGFTDELAKTSKSRRLDSLRAHRKGQETRGQD